MRKLIIANWKMNKLRRDSLLFIKDIALQNEIEIAIAAPFLSIFDLKTAVSGRQVKVGAQTMSEHAQGAYTGEVSASMLRDVGCDFVLLGHSERRKLFLESNEVITKKVERAVVENMPFVLCVGETLSEREMGQTEEILSAMLEEALSSLIDLHYHLVTIAYEPVWAIGTGKVASKEIITQTHSFIKNKLKELAGDEADNIRILYGGSVESKNIKEILSIPNVDGALVGGASLEALSFNQLISKAVV